MNAQMVTGSIRKKEREPDAKRSAAMMSREEYLAKQDWLRNHPHGERAREIARELREVERELESQGENVEAWSKPTALSPWYVAFWPERDGELASTDRHRERDCQHIGSIGDHQVRPATEAELEKLPPCATCG